MELLKYYHTLKYLKPEQFIYRLIRKVSSPKKRFVNTTLEPIESLEWVDCSLYQQKLFSPNKAIFLNHQEDIGSPNIWNQEDIAKLWLYNLHYFDDLNAQGKENRKGLHCDILQRWIEENPWGERNGWEPYPTSLRIVNITKASLSGLPLNQEVIDSLAMQADYLSQDLEKHLLGNHLFANAKALIFSGLFFAGNSADNWLRVGLEILEREINEQVLDDGGNFELTPMYHAIMLVDLLDLVNIFNVYPSKVQGSLVSLVVSKVKAMLEWLPAMTHLDGEISFFNDSAMGIAPSPDKIAEYARLLSIEVCGETNASDQLVSDLTDSGYVSVKSKDTCLITDIAGVGPDYIPGHAHADTLSFELSLFGRRLFVNSGTSEYGLGEERLRQRSTQAHNTVSINGMNSSQVWSGFRVAKRAQVFNKGVSQVGSSVEISASHDGFEQQGAGCIHSRIWQIDESSLTIVDEIKGSFDSAIGYLHLHPDVEVVEVGRSKMILNVGNKPIELSLEGGSFSLKPSSWHPEFGVGVKNECLNVVFDANKVRLLVSWGDL